jgi:concanavalin A-like lectin/glucanase superfamily protein/F5/8 type C domain-containing protein
MCSRFISLFSCFLVLGLVLASTVQAADPSLIGWWPLNEEAGDIAVDASGNGNDGALVGDTFEWMPDGGRYRGALSYGDVQTDYVEISTANMSTSAGTFTVWGYLAADQTSTREHYFFGHTTIPAFGSRIQLYMDVGDTDLDLGLGDAHTRATALATLKTETWYHLALTWDNGQYVVYLDGEVINSGSYTGLDALNETAAIGNDGNTGGQAEAFRGLLDECRLYNRALPQEEVQVAMRTSLGFGTAGDPVPADEATDVLRDAALSWAAGEFANTHDVYLGTTFDDVNDADRANPADILVSQGQTGTSYVSQGVFGYGQTYYWRVDEVNAAPDNTIFKGNVWSFTVEPFGYAVENIIATASDSGANADIENTVNGSGLNENDEHSIDDTAMWLGTGNGVDPVWIQYEFDRTYKLHELLVWNYNVQFELMLGFGLKDVTIEYSADGVEWTVFGDVEFAQATATANYTANTAIALDGIMAKYVRLTVISGHGILGQFGLSEVRFLYVPAHARLPEPADGTTDVSPTATLGWRAGRGVALHEVYLSTDEAAVADGTALVDTVVQNSYPLSSLGLEYGNTYFWKINEVNDAAAVTSWESDVWSFSAQEFFVVDDFESYTNDEGSRIYEAWLDGWVNETGSTVGYLEEPFAEQTIVSGGSQSMPLAYDNGVAPFYSEAEFELNGQNWAANGADTLRLFVQGETHAFVENSDGSIAMSAIGADIWGTADEGRYVYKNLTGDGSIIARVDYLDGTSNAWAKAGVMIRQSTDVGSMHAFTALTGGEGGGAAFQRRIDTDGESTSDHGLAEGPYAPPTWVKVERVGNSFSSFLSVDGQTWTQAGSTLTIAMQDPVLIGLAATSHDATVATNTGISNLSTTGDVAGQWQMAEIGVAQPAGSNDPAPMYVAIEDAAGNTAVVANPYAAVLSSWQEWLIPLSDFAGVNLNSVTTMYIGVGDRNTPTAGGSGLVFVDDIGIGQPASDD